MSLELISHKNCLAISSWWKLFQYIILIPDEIISRKIVVSRMFCQILFILLIGLIYPHSKFCIISYVGSFWHLIVSLAFYLPKIYCASLRWEQYQYQFQMHFLSMFIFHFSSKCLCILCIEVSLTSYVQIFLSIFPDSWIGINLVDFLKSEQKVKISKWLIDNFANCGINSFYMHFAKCGDLWSFMNIFLMVKGKS